MSKAKRIQYHRYGGPEVMGLEDFEPARPASGEVLVRVRAAAANPMDWGIRAGELKMLTGRRFPRGMGHDFAGVVEAVGEDITRLAVGDPVMGGASLKASGAFGELVVAEETGLVRKPADLSYEEAAAIPTVGLTAFQALIRKGELRAGEAVFVNGCLGGVGRAATQIALAHGATVGGSCRAGTEEEARALGVDPVVGFDPDPEAAALKGRFDLVFDTAGTLAIKDMRKMLKHGGRILDINPSPLKFLKSALPGPFQVMIAKAVPGDLEEVARLAAEGKLRLPIGRAVPLTEAIPALTELERSGTPKGGKLVIMVAATTRS